MPQMSLNVPHQSFGASGSTSALRIDSNLFPRAFANIKAQKRAMREEDKKHTEAISSMRLHLDC